MNDFFGFSAKSQFFFVTLQRVLYICPLETMKEPKRILFLSQEIYPYLDEITELSSLNRKLPQLCQEQGIETRTFMPKFGEINERRNQLHEVIRLSGSNIAINDIDHPLLLKVASIQQARIQIYFTDNDDFFHRRKGLVDSKGKEYPDNDERSIFYVRSSYETIQRLRWVPDLIICSGWMSALAPLYLKTAFKDVPFFSNTKIAVALDHHPFNQLLPSTFAQKAMIRGVTEEDMAQLWNKRISYYRLMKVAIDYADAVAVYAPKEAVHKQLFDYAAKSGKPFCPYSDGTPQSYFDFYNQLL